MQKPLAFKLLQTAGHLFIFVSLFFAFSNYDAETPSQSIRIFAFYGILPLACCAFLWHTIFSGNIIKQTSAFFEYEAGGANLGIAIALFFTWYRQETTHTICYILLIYFIYLLTASICHVIFRGWKKGLLFLPLLLMLLFFISVGF